MVEEESDFLEPFDDELDVPLEGGGRAFWSEFKSVIISLGGLLKWTACCIKNLFWVSKILPLSDLSSRYLKRQTAIMMKLMTDMAILITVSMNTSDSVSIECLVLVGWLLIFEWMTLPNGIRSKALKVLKCECLCCILGRYLLD